jgi:very-short-patch-repair endonuclease
MSKMPYDYNKRLVGSAQYLRKSMTDEEKKLWYQFLRRLPVTVRRQKNIGNYIVDFYIASAKIVIEIDGIQHQFPENKEKDDIRDDYLNDLGIKVMRFNNLMINDNFGYVCKKILTELELTFQDLKPQKTDRSSK